MREQEESFDAWISSYCLSEGKIRKVRGSVSDRFPDVLAVKTETSRYLFTGEGKNWHRTEEEALRVADQKRKKKIASLQKQIAKLTKLEFRA